MKTASYNNLSAYDRENVDNAIEDFLLETGENNLINQIVIIRFDTDNDNPAVVLPFPESFNDFDEYDIFVIPDKMYDY